MVGFPGVTGNFGNKRKKIKSDLNTFLEHSNGSVKFAHAKSDRNPACQLIVMIKQQTYSQQGLDLKIYVWHFSDALEVSENYATHISWRQKFTVNKEIHSLTPTSAYTHSRLPACPYLLLFILTLRPREKNTPCRNPHDVPLIAIEWVSVRISFWRLSRAKNSLNWMCVWIAHVGGSRE